MGKQLIEALRLYVAGLEAPSFVVCTFERRLWKCRFPGASG